MSEQKSIERWASAETKQAWLITWEWAGDWKDAIERGLVDKKVVAILNYRHSGYTVKKLVEQFYISSRYALFEQVACAKNKKNNPYRAEFGTVNGVPYIEEVVCGHNPWLKARRVYNLRVYMDENSVEHLSWEEYKLRLENGNPVRVWSKHEVAETFL